MARPLRIEYEHAFYHVMNRGKGRQDIFCGEGYFQAFVDALGEAVERFDAVIHCYCLMNNHYHLLIETPLGNLGRIMRHINGVYTQRYNRMKKTDGPLFRGRYKAILIDADSYLLQLSSYIHRNPIACQNPLVEKLKDWTWSSYPAYVGKVCAPSWLTLSEIREVGGFNGNHKKYEAFVECGHDDVLSEVYCKKHMPAILGDQYFKESALQRAQLSHQRGHPSIYSKPSADRIVYEIGLIFDMTSDEITAKNIGARHLNWARKLAIYSCQQLGGMKLKDIAHYFNLASDGVVSGILANTKKKILEGFLMAKYGELQERLK